jgi:hypothetical protein
MMNFMGPMEQMQHQGGFAPNNPSPMMASGGMSPMGGMMGPSPEVLQKLIAMFRGGQNPGGQMMPPQANNGQPSMIGMSKPTNPGFMPHPMRAGGFKDTNILEGENRQNFNIGPSPSFNANNFAVKLKNGTTAY